MKKSRLRAVAIGIALVTALSFSACKKEKGEKFEPSFMIKMYEGEGYRFNIPQEWGQIADPTASGVLVFAGEDAYESDSGFNNVSVCIYDSSQPAPTLEEAKAAFEGGFEAKVKETCPDAANFVYESIETGTYTVLTAEYRYSVMGKELVQKVYYPLVNGKQIYVAACDTGNGAINADEAAHALVNSLMIDGETASEDGEKEASK